ncbi:hypothetical protein [Haloferax sp. YSSS75]|uniref:hypothetical protein n=1 Tax=Haloferax sp. YSSS75 TaxID=3388564 RepID=UPI00398CB871
MPTLRNKTTAEGIIVRWKPHPRHNRPSTYQVSPRAVSFLENLGYKVSQPGDEVTIPPQICRPLRLLGDLYFESGSQDDVDLENQPSPSYYTTSTLSKKQLSQLRSYVESHPSYIGGLREGLENELTDLPGSEDDTDIPRPRLEPQSRSVRYASDGRILLPEPFYIGKIDRISNNRNAIVSTTEQREVNLGRLPKSVVGEWTVCIEYRGVWTMCLTPQLWSDGYRSDAREYIGKLEELTGLTGLNRILNIQRRQYHKDISDAEMEVHVYAAGHGLGIAYYGEWTIIIDSELVTTGDRIHVTIEDCYGNVATAIPHRPRDASGLSVGDQVNLEVSKFGQNFLVGTCDGELLVVPRETEVTPEEIQVAVTELYEKYAIGTVQALDDNARPSVDEDIDIEGEMTEKYPGIPVFVPEFPGQSLAKLKLPVATVNTDSVSVSARAFQDQNLFTGDTTITSPIEDWVQGSVVLHKYNVPVLVPGVRYVPGMSVEARPKKFEDGYVEAEFEKFDLPKIPQTFGDGIKQGDSKLRAGEYTEAISIFTATVEMTNLDDEPTNWLDAVLHEILALTEFTLTDKSIEEALEVLEIRIESVEENGSLAESIRRTTCDELNSYRLIIETTQRLQEADQVGDRSEATAIRSQAKNLLTDAVEYLANLESLSGRERPHWLIKDQLKRTTDEMLLLSPPVKNYLRRLED